MRRTLKPVLGALTALATVTARSGMAASSASAASSGDPGDATIVLDLNDSSAGGSYEETFKKVFAGVAPSGTPVYIYVPNAYTLGSVPTDVRSMDPTYDWNPADDSTPCAESSASDYVLTQAQINYLGNELTNHILAVDEAHYGEIGLADPADADSDALVMIVYDMPLNEVIEQRLEVFARAPGLLEVERVMKSAMEFRAVSPWMVANPAANMDWLQYLLKKFQAPTVVIDGALGHIGDGSIAGSEIVFELHYQAIASQLLGPVLTGEDGAGRLQCGFGCYKIARGCPYQESHNCSTTFSPAEGPPVPTGIDGNDVVFGCTFAFGLEKMTGDLQAIKLLPTARFPAI